MIHGKQPLLGTSIDGKQYIQVHDIAIHWAQKNRFYIQKKIQSIFQEKITNYTDHTVWSNRCPRKGEWSNSI